MWACSCMYVCVFMHVWVFIWACLYMNACTYGSQRSALGVIPWVLSTLFLEKVSLTGTWDLPRKAGRLVNPMDPLVLGLQMEPSQPGFLYGCWGSNSGHMIVWWHFINWAVSLAPRLTSSSIILKPLKYNNSDPCIKYMMDTCMWLWYVGICEHTHKYTSQEDNKPGHLTCHICKHL